MDRPDRYCPLCEHLRQRDQLRTVEIEHAACLGLVAGGHVVAGQAADVLHPVHRRAHQLGLEREPVAVAAGQLHHRLDAGLDQPDGDRQRRGVRVRGRVVGRVERVHERLHRRQLAHDLGVAAAVDHRQLGGDHELPGVELSLKIRHRRRPPSRPGSACRGR